MKTIPVTRQALPGVGVRFELHTASGADLIVVADNHGRRELLVRPAGADTGQARVSLDPGEVVAVVGVLIGSAIELRAVDASDRDDPREQPLEGR